MKFRLLKTIVVILMLCGPAAAQQLPDSIFNTKIHAFGNTLQDVPPDIIEVGTSPEQPSAGEKVWVRAILRTDPDMTPFLVNRAKIYFATDSQNYTAADMQIVDEKQSLWQASLPGFPAGTRVDFALAAWDEVGNAVFQVPRQSKVSRDGLFPVIFDDNDTDIPDGLDILQMDYGTDGTTLFYCQRLQSAFQTFTLLGASANAMGIFREDVRFFRHRSYSENNDMYLAYVPAFELNGLVTIDNLIKDIPPENPEGVIMSAKGDRVCARAPIAALSAQPARGLKVFSATVAVNPGTEDIALVDFSPYAILYFGGSSYTVAQ